MTEKEALVALSAFVPFGPARIGLLRQYFGSYKNVWRAPLSKLRETGLPEKLTGEFFDFRENFSIDAYFAKLEKHNVRAVIREDKEYPARLAEISDPPVVLYVKGKIVISDEVAVAVVGSRKITSYGREAAYKIAGDLAASGVTVVSGLALGVDGIAHRAAIDAGGRTLAVIGSGLDQIYPPSHKSLAADIEKNGAVISEYPLGYPALPINFPWRNRIISGISLGVVVIEGTEKSGTLLTATHAASQGREVFAVPGPITSPNSGAPHLLIKQGAKVVTDVRDILEELEIKNKQAGQEFKKILPGSDEERMIIGVLGVEPLHADEIVRRLGKGPGVVASTLTTMELKGMVKNLGGMVYTVMR